ncbi:asparagine synthase (glutamine-hydrolyzing) [Candidatus Curtissbacteria bacterium]|nr:asparagine synthase (glutamine-hydrolyzing) [Candidatus Curtissbacteria bacterium]
MCGIFGRLNLDQPVTDDQLATMSKALIHRGPDEQKWKIFASFGFGVNRLSIIDVAGGQQPLSNENKTIWAVQNGEIYNYQSLSQKLKKNRHRFSSVSDSEVLVHLYEDYGAESISHLSGMFALAIWDQKNQRLLLATDRLGIKPLYYSQQKNFFLFASEVKALLSQGIDRDINPQALSDYLSLNYIPGPQTIFSGVFKLPPATVLVYERGKMKQFSYWQLKDFVGRETKLKSEEELIHDLRSFLDDALKAHLVSDVPLGIFLSGGLDSSAVTAFAVKHNPKIKTFSVGFKESSYDELGFARSMAKLFKTDHQEIMLNLNIRELVSEMAHFWDEPFADSSAVPTFVISKAARQKVKVILTGDGGDEVFAGYEIYKADKLLHYYQNVPLRIRSLIANLLLSLLPVSHEKMSLDLKVRRFIRGSVVDAVLAHYLWRAIFTQEEKEKLYITKPHVLASEKLFAAVSGEINSGDLLNRLLYVDTKISLVDDMLTKVDRMSMANGIEVRVPLLDYRLVEFMASLPSEFKVRGLTLKYLLKKSLRTILPDAIIDRAKAGFHAPVPHWLNHELNGMVKDYLNPRKLKEFGNFFNALYVAKMISEHRHKKADWSRNLWGLLMFQLWYEEYMKTS